MMKNQAVTDMNFETFHYAPRSTSSAPGSATNASREEVTIIENTLGRFELWVACDLIAQLSSFDEAKRFAECAVTFTMDRGTKVA
jgi:hypothetical protein